MFYNFPLSNLEYQPQIISGFAATNENIFFSNHPVSIS